MMNNFRQTLKAKVQDISSKDLSIDFAEPKVILVQSIICQMIRKVIDIIDKELTSAQPEIVRCKDCKFYSPMNRETKTGICNLTMHQNFGDDWFCAGAERRNNEYL